jgi:hypothetical protein
LIFLNEPRTLSTVAIRQLINIGFLPISLTVDSNGNKCSALFHAPKSSGAPFGAFLDLPKLEKIFVDGLCLHETGLFWNKKAIIGGETKALLTGLSLYLEFNAFFICFLI